MFLTMIIWSILMLLRSGAKTTTHVTTKEVEKFHLKLHKSHCGDIVTCDSGAGHPDPRTIYAIPVPCCLPCPCLQSCSSKQICCPEFGSPNDNDSFSEESFGISKSDNVSQISVTESMEHTTTGVELLHQNMTNMSILDQKQDNQVDVDQSHNTDGTKFSTRSTKLDQTNADGTANPLRTVCVRAQLFDRPNYFIDSKAYAMVDYCFQGNTIVDKCYGEHVGKGISEMLPITSKLTGLTYWNRFCFLCNEGGAINDKTVEVWDAVSVNYKAQYDHRFVFHPDEMADTKNPVGTGGNHNIHFVPKTNNLAHQCETYDIISCNQTGLWQTYDEHIETGCHEGHSLPILHQINVGQKELRFKNIACVYCNVDNSFNNGTKLSCGYYKTRTAYSYSLTLNIGNGNMNKASKESREKQMLSYTKRAILLIPNTGACPTGYISLLGRCRRILCPRDHYVRNNRCVPLYRTITGLDINVKIKVSLIDRVLKSLTPELLVELREMLNTSLTKYVTLKPREISIWYGPTRNKVRDRYYMFDIFLFNSSTTIDVRTSTTEIRAFYNYLNSLESIPFSNDLDGIRMKITFNHRLVTKASQYYDMSISGGGSLKVMVGKNLDDRVDRPAMLLSDINWCYRVPFDIDNETDTLGINTYLLKPAGIIVYRDQIEEYHHWDPEVYLLYACVDLFIKHIDEDQLETTRVHFLAPDPKNNNIMDLPVRVNIAIIAACLCLFAWPWQFAKCVINRRHILYSLEDSRFLTPVMIVCQGMEHNRFLM